MYLGTILEILFVHVSPVVVRALTTHLFSRLNKTTSPALKTALRAKYCPKTAEFDCIVKELTTSAHTVMWDGLLKFAVKVMTKPMYNLYAAGKCVISSFQEVMSTDCGLKLQEQLHFKVIGGAIEDIMQVDYRVLGIRAHEADHQVPTSDTVCLWEEIQLDILQKSLNAMDVKPLQDYIAELEQMKRFKEYGFEPTLPQQVPRQNVLHTPSPATILAGDVQDMDITNSGQPKRARVSR